MRIVHIIEAHAMLEPARWKTRHRSTATTTAVRLLNHLFMLTQRQRASGRRRAFSTACTSISIRLLLLLLPLHWKTISHEFRATRNFRLFLTCKLFILRCHTSAQPFVSHRLAQTFVHASTAAAAAEAAEKSFMLQSLNSSELQQQQRCLSCAFFISFLSPSLFLVYPKNCNLSSHSQQPTTHPHSNYCRRLYAPRALSSGRRLWGLLAEKRIEINVPKETREWSGVERKKCIFLCYCHGGWLCVMFKN
jgi:hypothetical protein